MRDVRVEEKNTLINLIVFNCESLNFFHPEAAE